MKKLTIFYDIFCPNCTKFTHTIKKLDWLHLLEIKKLRDENITNVHKEIDIKLAGQQMASFVNKWQYGYFSLFSIFARIPILWIFAPLFFILKITGLGQLLYIQFAIKRRIIPLHCSVDSCGK